MKNKELMFLCRTCLEAFRDGTKYRIVRTENEIRDTCDFCQYRSGWEYEFIDKQKERELLKVLKIVRRGEIYIADLNSYKGSEQGGVRPVLILQNNTGNYYSPTTIIAPITTKPGKEHLPVHVNLDKCDCLEKRSKVLLEQIRVIDKRRLRRLICTLNEKEMAQVNDALLISVGMEKK